MAKIKIDKTRCKGCYLCITNCPNGLIKVDKKINQKGVKPAVFSGGKPARPRSKSGRSGGCSGCAMCAIICPECGISVYRQGTA